MAGEINRGACRNKSKFIELFYGDTVECLSDRGSPLLHPLEIQHCNGTGPWPFSLATIEYKKCLARPAFLWYRGGFLGIPRELLEGTKIFSGEKTIESLIDVAILDKHTKCLKSLITEKQCEARVQAVLAIHYFQPLVHGSSCMVDAGSISHCEGCKEKISYGDTTFGNKRVWHGKADIFIHKSIIKVGTEEIEDTDVVANAGGEPAGKIRKIDNSSEKEKESLTSILETKLEKSKDINTESQALAQAIVNAFYEARRDRSLYDKFIPSFLATEQNIQIILYNCKLDILLLSDNFPIWNENIKLSTKTLVQVWLALNFEKFDMDIPVDVLKRTEKSKFKKAIGDDIYSIYSEEIQKPLATSTFSMGVPKYVYKDFDIFEEEFEIRKQMNTELRKLYNVEET